MSKKFTTDSLLQIHFTSELNGWLLCERNIFNRGTNIAASANNSSTTSTTNSPAAQASDAVLTVTRTYNYITPIQGILNFMGQPALATPTITGRGRMRCNG